MSDTCGVCNRPLLDPESRAAGIGPTCAKKFHGSTATAGSHQLTFEEPMTDPKPTGRCGNDPRTVLSPGDQAAVAEFKEYLAEKARADRAEAAIKRTVDQMRAYVVASGSAGVNPKQVIDLLSPTWPNGNHEAPAPGPAEPTAEPRRR
ncbi:hypothetical protein I6J39_16805 [Streptomyces californicus]|uniref:Uncharacterized protein n=1 Tax=Streptomyces californicus TaxID=67351 RepID=A0ABX7J365_9ACTN|nr:MULTISPECIES: DUF6011 domain-containing protein [Streptomyces]QRV28783.1 hypothetical protein I6J39_16805 [Streptomyces californicus]QRV42197.1 hypothetical protein I6J41_16720 [Streptomyces californicus]